MVSVACGGEGGPIEVVRGLVFGVVALQGKSQRGVGGVVGGKFELDFVDVFRLGAELERFGVGVAAVVMSLSCYAEVGQIELAERQDEVGFFLGPVEEVWLRATS